MHNTAQTHTFVFPIILAVPVFQLTYKHLRVFSI